MKKFISMALVVLMCLSCFSLMSFAEETGEHLTEIPEGYTGVYTIEDLYCVRNDLTANYILMNDIDLSVDTAEGGDWDFYGNGWNPIGSGDVYSNNAFSGTFDGNGYLISGMRITCNKVPSGTGDQYLGLFSNVSGTVKNLTVEGDITWSVSRGYDIYAGGIAAYSSGTIENCTNRVSVSVKDDSSSSYSSYYYIYAGGIVGYSTGTISRCRNLADIYAYGVYVYPYAGGICGYQRSNSSISATTEYCVNTGNIKAERSSRYSYSYASGIVGYGGGSINNCYNTGDVSGWYSAGVGYDSTCKYCYNVGAVSGTYAYAVSKYTSTKCYYLAGTGSDSTGATSLTKAQMKLKSMYSTWDFDTIWTMDGRDGYNYPQLRDVALIYADDYKSELEGEIKIVGVISVGSTLTVDRSGVDEDIALTYEWVVDGKTVSTEDSYVIAESDFGKDITVNATSPKYYKGVLTATVTVKCEQCSFTNYVSDNNATCTSDGTKTAVCDNGCGAKDTITDEGTKLDHTYTPSVTKEPTHIEEGERTYTCVCGDTYTESIAKLTDHEWDNGTVTTPATHTEEGVMTYTCTCGETKTEPIEKTKGHNYTATVTKQPTHASEGETTYVCPCGDIYSEPIAKLDHHSYTSEVTKEATHTEEGEITYTCTCGDTYTEPIEKTKGHSYTSEVTKEATHTEEGETTYTCACGDTYTEPIEKLTGHSYTSEVTKEATHTEEGETTYTCACGDTYTESIEKIKDHTYTSEVTKEATHTEEGETTYTCACGDSYTETIEKIKDHTYTSEITKQPTHKEEGEMTYTCACGDTYTESIDKLADHVYVAEVTVKATCTQYGKVTYTCVCGDSYTESIPATGHTDANSDGYCDTCGKDLDPEAHCSCSCHKTGIAKILFVIVNFFQKLFGNNTVCDCGAKH